MAHVDQCHIIDDDRLCSKIDWRIIDSIYSRCDACTGHVQQINRYSRLEHPVAGVAAHTFWSPIRDICPCRCHHVHQSNHRHSTQTNSPTTYKFITPNMCHKFVPEYHSHSPRPLQIIMCRILLLTLVIIAFGCCSAQSSTNNDVWRPKSSSSVSTTIANGSHRSSNVIHRKIKSSYVPQSSLLSLPPSPPSLSSSSSSSSQMSHHSVPPTYGLPASQRIPNMRMQHTINQYLNSQLYSLPFTNNHQLYQYRHQMLPHLPTTSSVTSSSMPVSLSNRIPPPSSQHLEFTHLTASSDNNIIRVKGSKWW